MKDQNIFKQLSEYKKILEEKGYSVLYIGLYGSQNYNLDDEESDFDAKAIILPSLHDIIFRKATSKTIECEKGSIDVKDLITFYDVIKKGNFSYIECINTKYSVGDKYIKELFEKFSVNLKSILGAMYEKRKALTHEYPSKTNEFEKWGYDPKQLHHIFRLNDILKLIAITGRDISFIDYKDKKMINDLISIKRNTDNVLVEEAIENADYIIKLSKNYIADDYKYEIINIDNEINVYIENSIKLNLLKNSEVMYAKQYRTFDGPIPKSDLKKFPILEQYDGQDISYLVSESVEIL